MLWLLTLFLSAGEKYEQAVECAKTFLLFHPEDEMMNQNLNYYSAVLGEEKAAAISARQVLLHSQRFDFIIVTAEGQEDHLFNMWPPKNNTC